MNVTVTTIQKSSSPAAVSSIAMIAAVVVALVAVAGVSVFYWRSGHVLPAVSMPASHVSQQASAPPAVAPAANLDNQGSQFLFELQARGIKPS
ncbi:MAG: hypothetical protein J2P16_14855, partial [Mycobacterium sp.]|nr:hypothetical protein [Mycobacterium sp.]